MVGAKFYPAILTMLRYTKRFFISELIILVVMVLYVILLNR